MSDMLNALTIDVEDWFEGIELDARDWDRFEPRLGIGMEALLSLLESERIRATFFVLGSVAQRHPQLVKRIAAEGHEVATHGLTHRFVYEIGREQFRQARRNERCGLEWRHSSCGKHAGEAGGCVPSVQLTWQVLSAEEPSWRTGRARGQALLSLLGLSGASAGGVLINASLKHSGLGKRSGTGAREILLN